MSEAVISNWNDNPTTYNGYYYAGRLYTNGDHCHAYMFSLADAELSNDQTTSGELGTWINHEVGASWYSVDGCASPVANCGQSYNAELDRWKGDANSDIITYQVPLVDEVQTCDTEGGKCMAGWTYRASHFQAMSQVNPSAGQIEYAETANATDSCGSGVDVIAPGDFTGNFKDPADGQSFYDSDGWDYDSEQFQFDRSEALVW